MSWANACSPRRYQIDAPDRKPLDMIERTFDHVVMPVEPEHTFHQGTNTPLSEPMPEAETPAPELLDFLTDALVRARLAVDALADSLRAEQGQSRPGSSQVAQRAPVAEVLTAVRPLIAVRPPEQSSRTRSPEVDDPGGGEWHRGHLAARLKSRRVHTSRPDRTRLARRWQ